MVNKNNSQKIDRKLLSSKALRLQLIVLIPVFFLLFITKLPQTEFAVALIGILTILSLRSRDDWKSYLVGIIIVGVVLSFLVLSESFGCAFYRDMFCNEYTGILYFIYLVFSCVLIVKKHP